MHEDYLELAAHILGIDPNADFDIAQMDENLEERFNISLEDFQTLADALITYTYPLPGRP